MGTALMCILYVGTILTPVHKWNSDLLKTRNTLIRNSNSCYSALTEFPVRVEVETIMALRGTVCAFCCTSCKWHLSWQCEIQMLRLSFWWESAAETIDQLVWIKLGLQKFFTILKSRGTLYLPSMSLVAIQSGASFDCLSQMSKSFQCCGIGLVGLIQFFSLWRNTLMWGIRCSGEAGLIAFVERMW